MATPVKPGTTPSLPGAMSTRTDGGPASKQAIRYAAGEPGAEDFVNLQRQAALAKTPGAKSMTPSQVAQAASQGGEQSARSTSNAFGYAFTTSWTASYTWRRCRTWC